MEKPIVFMFSGQGSQFFHMGRVLYKSDPVFRRVMTQLDEIAGDMTGRSVVKAIYNPDKSKGDLFDDILLSHPAIFMVASAVARALSDRGIVPHSIVGASLGEFVAAGLYGMMDFETAFKTVLRQPMLFRGELKKGGMLAVLANSDFFHQTPLLRDNSEIAAVNFDTHFVLSATENALKSIRRYLTQEGIDHFVLPVNYAFHSSHLDRIREKFIALYHGMDFHPPEVEFNSCADALEIDRIDPDYFWRVIRQPIRFSETIIRLASKRSCTFVDVGPSGTLATFAKYILSKSKFSGDGRSESLPILTPFGHESDNLNTILKRLRPVPKPVKTVQANVNPFVILPGTLPTKPSGTSPEKPSEKSSEELSVKLFNAISGQDLGSHAFKKRFNLTYACLAGGMFRGISSADLVARMGNVGMLGFFGTHGLPLEQVKKGIAAIRRALDGGREFGMNLSAGPGQTTLVDLFLEQDISCIEASGFVGVSPELVKYRAAGMGKDPNHPGMPRNRIIAKLSRPEVAEHFLRPPQSKILDHWVATGDISVGQAAMARQFPMADALCVTADCGGRTDRGTLVNLLPMMIGLRNRVKQDVGYDTEVFVGAAGGIGTPEAAAAAFVLGADFILTGSINQCTPEAGTSDRVKAMLQRINIQDTTYAPSSDGFEMGATVQVISKSLFFPVRANTLFALYQHYDSLEEIPEKMLRQLGDKYFGNGAEIISSFSSSPLMERGGGGEVNGQVIQDRFFNSSVESVDEKLLRYFTMEEINRVRNNPKREMAMIFKWYLENAVSLALAGQETDTINFQVYCGSCLGAFNQWVAGTGLENWHTRHVDAINKKLIEAAATLLTDRFQSLNRVNST